jgi:hypothetical protein
MLVGLDQRRVLNVKVGFRVVSSLTAAPASSLSRAPLLISPKGNDCPLDRHSCNSTTPNVASRRAKWAYRCKCLSGNFARNRSSRRGCRTGNVTSCGDRHGCLEIWPSAFSLLELATYRRKGLSKMKVSSGAERGPGLQRIQPVVSASCMATYPEDFEKLTVAGQ